MTVANIAKRILPLSVLNFLGTHAVELAVKNNVTMQALSLVIDDQFHGVKLLPNGLCSKECYGKELVCFRDGWRIFNEVLDDRIYEKYWTPKTGDIVLDLGAYVGMFTYLTSRAIGDNGLVVAVEPDWQNSELLIWNIRELRNVKMVNAAIGEHDGCTQLGISPKSTSHSITDKNHKTRVVASITIDSLTQRLKLPRIDFIKMDIEGAEMLALEGAEQTLKGDTKWAIECYHLAKIDRQKLAKCFVDKGFRVRWDSKKEYIYADRI